MVVRIANESNDVKMEENEVSKMNEPMLTVHENEKGAPVMIATKKMNWHVLTRTNEGRKHDE